MNLEFFLLIFSTMALCYWLEEHTKWAFHISGVLLLIILAALLGNLGLVPTQEEHYSVIFKWAVPFGIILMLLAFDPTALRKIKKEFIICFIVGAVGTTIGGLVAGFIFKQYLLQDYWRISGQLTASFIGGYENAVAVGTSLQTPTPTFVTVFAGDSVLTTLWILINIFQGRKIKHASLGKNEAQQQATDYFSQKIDLTSLSISVAISIGILMVSFFLHNLIPNISKIIWASLFATLVTFTPLRKRFTGSYVLGSLLLSVFFFACGAISDLATLFKNATILLAFPATIVFIHAIILFGFAKIFKIKKDIAIVVSQSLIGGPATALAVVTARKWNFQYEVIILGLLGYAIGNYFGFGVAWILK